MLRTLLVGTILSVSLPITAQVNDLCSSVTPDALTAGGTLLWTGDNTGATIDNDYAPGSIFSSVGIPAVWHGFTLTGCADIKISYCGTAGPFTEFWNALATTCPGNNQFISTQQYNYSECGDGNPSMYFPNVQGGTYYFPVWTEVPGANGPYTITVDATTCGGNTAPNDNCASVTAEALNVGESLTLSGNNTFATSTGDFAVGSPYAGAPVVWHAFTTTECAKVTLSYCGLDPVWTNSFGFFARNCPASDLVLFSTFDNTTCTDGNRTYVFNQLQAGTYYVPVLLDVNDNAVGNYDLILSAEACPTAPSYSDLCSQVTYQPLSVGSSLTMSGDNTTATGTGDFDASSPFNGAPVVWHGITTTQCSRITVSYCGLDPVWGNTFGFLASVCPVVSPLLFSTFNNTDCVEGNRTYIFNNVPPGNYLIPVVRDEANNAVGAYSLQVSAAACPAVPPANDRCADVTAENLVVGSSLTFSGDNTNATNTNDFIAGSPFAAASVAWHAFTTSECSDVIVDYCGQDPVWANTFGFFATACPGDGLVYFSTTNATNCAEGNTTYYFNDLAAGTYYLPVLRDGANNSVGVYNVNVTAENCLFLGASELSSPGIAVWPNPTDGEITVSILPAGKVQALVLDAVGRVVLSTQTARTGGMLRIGEPGAFAPGVYTLLIIGEQQRDERRFLVH